MATFIGQYNWLPHWIASEPEKLQVCYCSLLFVSSCMFPNLLSTVSIVFSVWSNRLAYLLFYLYCSLQLRACCHSDQIISWLKESWNNESHWEPTMLPNSKMAFLSKAVADHLAVWIVFAKVEFIIKTEALAGISILCVGWTDSCTATFFAIVSLPAATLPKCRFFRCSCPVHCLLHRILAFKSAFTTYGFSRWPFCVPSFTDYTFCAFSTTEHGALAEWLQLRTDTRRPKGTTLTVVCTQSLHLPRIDGHMQTHKSADACCVPTWVHHSAVLNIEAVAFPFNSQQLAATTLFTKSLSMCKNE